RAAYDAYAERYDAETDWYDRLMLGDGRRLTCARARGDVLEVAVGTGRCLPFYPGGVRLCGLDLSPGMLARARRRARAAPFPRSGRIRCLRRAVRRRDRLVRPADARRRPPPDLRPGPRRRAGGGRRNRALPALLPRRRAAVRPGPEPGDARPGPAARPRRPVPGGPGRGERRAAAVPRRRVRHGGLRARAERHPRRPGRGPGDAPGAPPRRTAPAA